jgi:hypothetical protein
MDTTARSFALAGSKPRHSALVVDAVSPLYVLILRICSNDSAVAKLVKAGAVILAKSQLSVSLDPSPSLGHVQSSYEFL